MKYYLTCGECGKEARTISYRGDRIVHSCPDGHHTTEVGDHWLERVVAVWDSPTFALPMSIGMRRYNVRKWVKRMWMKEPTLRLRAIVRLKEYKDGHEPRS